MQKMIVTAGLWAAARSAANGGVMPRKPEFSMAKTKTKLAEYFRINEETRQVCEENKAEYPRMHQSVQHTAWTLLMYYIKNWGKSVAQGYEIRITYSYLRQALNESCCVATLKNHINKLLRMYRGFVRAKSRGGLGLERQNTACIVLELDPAVLQFEDERHNEAVRIGELSAEESRRTGGEQARNLRRAAQGIMNSRKAAKAQAAERMEAPATFADIFQTAFASLRKRE